MLVKTTDTFERWFNKLKDVVAKAKINKRIARAKSGNLGDYKSVNDGIFEIRIDYGPGYRLYFIFEDKTIIVLLCGGDKSTQQKDIQKAKEMLC